MRQRRPRDFVLDTHWPQHATCNAPRHAQDIVSQAHFIAVCLCDGCARCRAGKLDLARTRPRVKQHTGDCKCHPDRGRRQNARAHVSFCQSALVLRPDSPETVRLAFERLAQPSCAKREGNLGDPKDNRVNALNAHEQQTELERPMNRSKPRTTIIAPPRINHPSPSISLRS